jgi:hypothetical protein
MVVHSKVFADNQVEFKKIEVLAKQMQSCIFNYDKWKNNYERNVQNKSKIIVMVKYGQQLIDTNYKWNC